jgi:hypothetical protein
MPTTPSITSWVRLEPRCRDIAMREAVRARVWDPLWLLARQWQVGEFEGEDAGSPVHARWRGSSAAITRVLAGPAVAGQLKPQRYDAAALPLEAVVERQAVRAKGPPDPGSSVRLAAESGLHFLRLLEAQATSRSYRADFVARYALSSPSDDERAALDAESLDYWDLMARRAPDGRLLRASWRGANGERLPLPADFDIAAGDRAEVNAAIDAWLAYDDALFSEPRDNSSDAWQRERMEYAFSLGAAFARGDGPFFDGEVALTAAEYRGGHLDWHSVDFDNNLLLGAALDNARSAQVRTVMPAPVGFRGAPARRFWEFEDARVDYGLLPAGPGDLPQLLLSAFATDYGNDWYVIPIDLDVGTLTRTHSLLVRDTFGVQTLIRPHNADVNTTSNVTAPAFSMFSLSQTQPQREGQFLGEPLPNLFYLAPSLLRSLDGTPRDEVLFLRDEMANMAWAVERLRQGRIEQRLEPAALPVPAASATTIVEGAGSAIPVYHLATDVPAHWVPLLPQRQAAPDGSLRLVRAAMLRPDGSNAVQSARGAILSGPTLKLYDEEVPREGMRVVRGYQSTRWIGGQTVLWLALRKGVGRGEGASGLRFDDVGL